MPTPFKNPRCSHHTPQYTAVCRHIYFEGAEDGYKHYLGHGWDCIYRCDECAEADRPATCQLCPDCVQQLEAEGYWLASGKPGIKREETPFHFQPQTIPLSGIEVAQIETVTPLHNHPSDAIITTTDGQLWQANLHNGATRLIAQMNQEQYREGHKSVTLSQDNQWLAFTNCCRQSSEPESKASNRGVLFSLTSGTEVMTLDCGDYHTEQADFPVNFVTHQDRTLVIHATDWNTVDITDPLNGQCLTQRDPEQAPPFGRDDALFTEWCGELQVSPDQQRIATIGWVWHPVGVAFSWNLQAWLNNNIWEADFGRSKRHYATWDYFWQSPFFWYDNHTLAIWGAPELHTSRDIPLDSVALYDADTEQQTGLIYGPTMAPFYYDHYLFTGLPEESSLTAPGIAVWCLQQGALLFEQTDLAPIAYHPGLKMFIERRNQQLIGWHWQCLS